LDPDDAILVCAVQNRAIEAIADKFEATSISFITIGRGVVGTAARHTLEEQLERNLPDDVKIARATLHAAEKKKSRHALELLQLPPRVRTDSEEKVLKDSSEKVVKDFSEARKKLEKAELDAYLAISSTTTALLCTTAAISAAFHDARLNPLIERVKTACLDEAGSAADRHVLPIIQYCDQVERLVLFGDSKQLPGVYQNNINKLQTLFTCH